MTCSDREPDPDESHRPGSTGLREGQHEHRPRRLGALYHAVAAAEAAEALELTRAVGEPDLSKYQGATVFPKWSEISEPGTVEEQGWVGFVGVERGNSNLCSVYREWAQG